MAHTMQVTTPDRSSLQKCFESCADIVISISIAVWHFRYLLLLPLYWDALSKLNWWLVCSEEAYEFATRENVRAEWRRFDRLCMLGDFSDAHGRMLSEFLRCEGDKSGWPVRPNWIRFE